MANYIIIGVYLPDRIKKATLIQKLFTEYGCCIKTRLGIHQVAEGGCSSHGLILLQLQGEEKSYNELIKKLKTITGVKVQKMVFT